MQNSLLKKGIVIGIIVLFVCTSIVSSYTNLKDEENILFLLSQNENTLSTDWWNTSWLYRKQITIDHTLVYGDLENFPVLVVNTSSDFVDHAQPDGDDFVFIDSSNTVQYNHELEFYDDETGELIVWVNVTSLSSSEDTILWIYYGNPDCGNQDNIAGTWNVNYIGVWHMGESSGNIIDSTGTKDGIVFGSPDYQETGKIGKCIYFDGVNTEYFDIVDDIYKFNQEDVFLEIWVYYVENRNKEEAPIFFGDDDYVPSLTVYKDRSGMGGYLLAFNRLTVTEQETAKSTEGGETYVGHWIYQIGRFEREVETSLWINGQKEPEVDNCSNNNLSSASQFIARIGRGGVGGGAYTPNSAHIYLDEVRVSNIVRNMSWINTSFNNQNSTASFIDIGDEESNIPETVYVDDDYNESTPGWGYDHFDKIQDGVDAVNESGTVYVNNGTYHENIVVNKNIDLIGENRDYTIIDGGGSGNVVYVSTDWINISGFKITNSDVDDAGIEIGAKYNTISGNNISINNYGIILSGSNNTITGNVIMNSVDGINLYKSSNNTINGNNISNNYVGIFLWNSGKNNITGNNISSNIYDGIDLQFASSSNTITSNTIMNNDNGLYIEFSSSNNIMGNNICSNNYSGIHLIDISDNNSIYHNNFINNSVNAIDESGGIWNDTYPSGGNYWSDYWGDDLYSGPDQEIPGPDGIGDEPYEIPCEHGTDYYPLMNPFETYYLLDMEAPSEVNEEEMFNAVVKSLGGTAVPNAIVEFNDELKLTDSDGRVYFTAPQVAEDTYFDIIATKEGYTGDTETILIKNVAMEFKTSFILGLINNLTTVGDVATFEAVNIRVVTFFPFSFIPYTSGELITISKDLLGIAIDGFIFALCEVAV